MSNAKVKTEKALPRKKQHEGLSPDFHEEPPILGLSPEDLRKLELQMRKEFFQARNRSQQVPTLSAPPSSKKS